MAGRVAGADEDINVDVDALDAPGQAPAYPMPPHVLEPAPAAKPGRQRPTNNQLL